MPLHVNLSKSEVAERQRDKSWNPVSAEPRETSGVNSRELIRAAMRRERTERIPVMPQICHDLAVRIYEGEFAADWVDGMKSCAENPDLIYELIIRLARQTGVDGLRLFVGPDPLQVERVGESLLVLDHSGGRLGRLDIHGGGEFVPDRQEPPVDTLPEYRARLSRLETEFTGEKLELLRRTRALVPDLFVASAPGGITMNTYTKFRGRERALMDLYERPDFVRAAFGMQTDIMITRAEKLIGTGIDALYIGDPAASSSLISPRHFEEFCLPAYRRFCRHFRASDILIYIHVCGNSRPILEMMAERAPMPSNRSIPWAAFRSRTPSGGSENGWR